MENMHRDHRELGRILDLFSFHEIAPGAPFWHPNGMMLVRVLEQLSRTMCDRAGYQEIATPILVKSDVFKISGHWDHYRHNMFYFRNPVDDKEELVVKPMNCPESTYIFNGTTRSYRDLPLRFSEIGRLHRNELSGTLGGLFRVRQITMDDAHIYCRPDQVESEVGNIISMTERFYALFGIKPTCVLATRPEKFMGDVADWDKAEQALRGALSSSGIKFEVRDGDGAFYGPKIEFHLRDSQDRDWQMGTAQLDLVMLPKQFDACYIDEDGNKKMPWVIHRAIYGSFERFIGMILEHTDGNLPPWLAPVQAVVMTVSDGQAQYAEEVHEQLIQKGIRSKLDLQNATISKKIREAEIKRIPYIVVVGEKEMKDKAVSIRKNTKPLADFLKEIVETVNLPTI